MNTRGYQINFTLAMIAEGDFTLNLFDLGIIIRCVHLQSCITFQETGILRKKKTKTKHN